MSLPRQKRGITQLQVRPAVSPVFFCRFLTLFSSVILAVSTNTSNPLQAISNLHSRATELPSWVDPAYLRYTLIVHPKDSTLSDEEYVYLLFFL